MTVRLTVSLPAFLQQIADAADRVDFDRCSGSLQFAAQMVDVDWNGIRLELVVDPVKLLLQDSLGHDAAKPAHQQLERGALAPRQRDLFAADRDVPAYRIEGDVAGLQDGPECAAGPTQQCLDARDHFDSGKRLDQI